MYPPWRKRGLARRLRRAQSEIVGGLIVLTLLFAFAIPMLLSSYGATVNLNEKIQTSVAQTKARFNEKIEIRPIDPNSEAAQRAGWIPGVFINNTGTTTVELDYLYLVNKLTNSVFLVFDLRYARPGSTQYIDDMLVDVDYIGSGRPPPPKGQPIVLKPGENLVVVFNESLLPYASNLVVLVETATGILHPLVGAGSTQPLYPGRPASGGAGGAGPGAWRGVFAPQSGFKLVGASELLRTGTAYAWTPGIHVWPEVWQGSWWWGDWELSSFDYQTSFIYSDPQYPGLYYLYIIPGENIRVGVRGCGYNTYATVYSGWTLIIKGYVGTYDTGGDGTYFNGWATEVIVRAGNYIVFHAVCDQPRNLGSSTVTVTDFDANGVAEVTFFSYLNGPNISSTNNVDADNDGDIYKDAVVWTYMVSRDISGVDFIKITAKINYYWTTVFSSSTGCPGWNYRHLATFAVAVWKYDEATGQWVISQVKDFSYTTDKPKQYQPVVVFPVDRSGTYRVGLLFYDNYRDWDGYGYWCHTDFTMTLEHIIVEYGVVNPLFVESPPLYIVAIPDPNIIRDIGEEDFMNAYNITDINEARVEAQQTLLSKLIEELNYAGVAGFTVISDAYTLCNLLFGDNPPKYATIIWLQGNVSVPYVLYTYSGACWKSDADIYQYIRDFHWVWVWPFGAHPFGSDAALAVYNNKITLLTVGNYTANITEQGVAIRKEAYAFYLFNTLKFRRLAQINPAYYDEVFISNGTLYYNETLDAYGTLSVWVYNTNYYPPGGPGTGAIIINPIHIDWDYTGDGAPPDTIVQQTVYSALKTWQYLRFGFT